MQVWIQPRSYQLADDHQWKAQCCIWRHDTAGNLLAEPWTDHSKRFQTKEEADHHAIEQTKALIDSKLA